MRNGKTPIAAATQHGKNKPFQGIFTERSETSGIVYVISILILSNNRAFYFYSYREKSMLYSFCHRYGNGFTN